MSKNPFNFKDEHVEKPLRSNFDLSFNNHLSVGFGKIYPVLCEQCYPGDSFDIQSAFGLDAMPMVFPVQSSVRAHLHFFWVPNRILWKEWMNYITNTADPSEVPPYIDLDHSTPSQVEFAKKFFSTGSLADYLGVPTTKAGYYGRGRMCGIEYFDGETFVDFNPRANPSMSRSLSRNISSHQQAEIAFPNTPFYYYTVYSHLGGQLISLPSLTGSPSLSGIITPSDQRLIDHIHPLSQGAPDPAVQTVYSYGTAFLSAPLKPEDGLIQNRILNFFSSGAVLPDYDGLYVQVYRYTSSFSHGTGLRSYDNLSHWRLCNVFFDISDDNRYVLSTNVNAPLSLQMTQECKDFINGILSNGNAVRLVITAVAGQNVTNSKALFNTDLNRFASPIGKMFSFDSSSSQVLDLSECDFSENPYISRLPISALPFRAYEAICNTYFRNDRVDPFIKNGRPVYNEWVTNNQSGADNTPYDFFYRNWELDAYTGCLPSPQQGIAPLVGMTALGNITIQDENGITTAKATIDNSGTITDVVLTSPAASTTHARTAMNIAAAGMSINDFRSTNALQRYLEKSIRRGYRYADQIMSHFGVEPKYDALDMPQFIGGVSQTIDVSKVIQNTPTDAPLGSFAGLGQIMGKVNHNIRHYCDEHGFIMATLCITPVPSYSQILPKHFTFLNNPLDYFSPEFNKIGMQPITYKELCPIQAYGEELATGKPVLDSTFGYQRPYHEMVRRVDEVHSLLRLDLRDYLINRIFNSRPELGHDFITCTPDECNDIFSVRLANDDKFVGQVSFKIYAKRPLPRTSIPSLE